MNPEVQLVLGCFLLGLLITYAWWVAIRVALLRFDLFHIRDKMDAAVAARRELGNAEYQDVRALIGYLIDEAENWYPSELMVQRTIAQFHDSSDRIKDAPNPVGESERIPEVQEALVSALLRVFVHIGIGHLRGWWFIMRIVVSLLLGGSLAQNLPRSLLRLFTEFKNIRNVSPHGARRSIPTT